MAKFKIRLAVLGSLKRPVDFEYLERWQTRVFSFEPRASIGKLPNMQMPHLWYSDQELRQLIREDDGIDITVAIINAPIQDNFYERAVNSHTAVISLYEMHEIVELAEHKIEHFILRCIYTIVLAYIQCDRQLDMHRAINLSHDEVRGCLFDMNINKTDVVYSLDRPSLCDFCKTRVSEKQVDAEFLSALDSEMARIRKDLFHRASDWIKAHPVCALLITATFAIILNLASNMLYDLGKHYLGSPSQNRAQQQGIATRQPAAK